MGKKKAMTSEKASYVRQKGYDDAREFAECLGIGKEFKSDQKPRKILLILGYSYSVRVVKRNGKFSYMVSKI